MALVDLTREQPGPERYTCANCGRTIGGHEQPYQWQDAIVCPQCCAVLQDQQVTQTAHRPQPRKPAVSSPRGVSLATLIGSLAVTAAVFYFAAVLPLQLQLKGTRKILIELSVTVATEKHNTKQLAAELDSLTETVNHNARVANLNNSR